MDMTHIFNSLPSDLILAQTQISSPFQEIGSTLGTDLGSSLLNVLKGVIILIVGWIVSPFKRHRYR